MRFNRKSWILLLCVCVVALAVAVTLWLLPKKLEHIEDTNGKALTLQKITDRQIVDMRIGALGAPTVPEEPVEDSLLFSSEKFTGVHEVYYDRFEQPSDFEVCLSGFKVSHGNFKVVVVHDGKIVHTLEPGLSANYRLEDVTGYVSLRIVGESAKFCFYITQADYDQHSHG